MQPCVPVAKQGLSWQVNRPGESTPEGRVTTISWSNLTGGSTFHSRANNFAASSAAARPVPAAAQVTLTSPGHHDRQRGLINDFYVCLLAFPLTLIHERALALCLFRRESVWGVPC